MTSRPAAGGGRWVSVAPERLDGWLHGFAERHGSPVVTAPPGIGRRRGAAGGVAECHVPFPPLPLPEPVPGDWTWAGRALVEHATRERRVGVVLVRLGGYAVGVFQGAELVASKVGS